VRAEPVVELESDLPAGLPAGTATAIWCCGYCFDPDERLTDIELVVDGARQAPSATAMPRPDLAHLGPAAFRSGFWGTVSIPAGPPGHRVQLALAGRTRVREWSLPLGHIKIGPARPSLTRSEADLIAVCLATYEPDMELLATQIASLREQTDRDWVCVISDDCSSPDRYEQIAALIADDPRFTLSRAEENLGFYRNFERALELVPPEAELVALCDQDDRWDPDKLATLRAALGQAMLVYSDQRLVDRSGRLLRDTMWQGRRNNHTDLASLLVANTITGAASLMRREVVELALPFPDPPGLQHHDHWLGLVALSAGDIAYVPRPLYDYVQHDAAVFGHVSSGHQLRSRRPLRGGRAAYFLGYLPREVMARTLLLRCEATLRGAKRRALARYMAADRSPVWLGWLAARAVRTFVGHDETLGTETDFVRGVVWRHVVATLARLPAGPWRRFCDTSVPGLLAFDQKRLRRWRARV
jgi:glycosyltransferase involved in cell wall biosynthesis